MSYQVIRRCQGSRYITLFWTGQDSASKDRIQTSNKQSWASYLETRSTGNPFIAWLEDISEDAVKQSYKWAWRSDLYREWSYRRRLTLTIYNIIMFGIGIIVFSDLGFHCIALELDVWPYWSEIGDSDWTFRAISLDVLLWAVYNLTLGSTVEFVHHPIACLFLSILLGWSNCLHNLLKDFGENAFLKEFPYFLL